MIVSHIIVSTIMEEAYNLLDSIIKKLEEIEAAVDLLWW